RATATTGFSLCNRRLKSAKFPSDEDRPGCDGRRFWPAESRGWRRDGAARVSASQQAFSGRRFCENSNGAKEASVQCFEERHRPFLASGGDERSRRGSSATEKRFVGQSRRRSCT